MTRINTNVSSLNAQKTLARSNASLQESLTRLSTGLRINSGKDDPAGLIASEVLRSDITSTERAISNSTRANQVIATADSALGQISSLLNDIRGLVVEAANVGAMSADQIAANQLQIDSSLEAINRIAQTTTFQGRKLLDGSLGFITSATQNFANIEDLEIDQANLGATGQIDVEIEIAAAATKAQITNTPATADASATATLSFAAGAAVTLANGAFEVRATALGTAEDAVTVSFVDSASDDGLITSAVYNSGASTLVITGDFDGIGGGTDSTIQDIVDRINTDLTEFEAETGDGAQITVIADAAVTAVTGIATLQVVADTVGANFNNLAISLTTATGIGAATPTAVYDADANTLVLTVDDADSTALSTLETVIEAVAEGFTATVDTSDTAATRTGVSGDSGAADATATANTLYTGGGVLSDSLVVEVAGSNGVEVFNFEQYTKLSAVVSAINLMSDALGVSASSASGALTLNSTEYGTEALVSVSVIGEGAAGTFESTLSAARSTGTDIDASVNGFNASGNGNILSLNTTTLDMAVSIAAETTDTIQFSITGGGALFQLGPDVVSNQQARLGIQSVNTAQLRTDVGRLYELASGQAAALVTDTTKADGIIDGVISKIVSLRGRLGAFQKTTLNTNIAALTETLETLTQAESDIRDTDFAKESAALTRAQILVQSGLSVLGIANQNPQSVLSLLR